MGLSLDGQGSLEINPDILLRNVRARKTGKNKKATAIWRIAVA